MYYMQYANNNISQIEVATNFYLTKMSVYFSMSFFNCHSHTLCYSIYCNIHVMIIWDNAVFKKQIVCKQF